MSFVRDRFALLALVVLAAACSAPKKQETPKQVTKETRWPACDPNATTQKLSFVHINDMHSNYQLNAQGVSRYALVRSYYLKVKQENPFTIFTSAGDEYEKGAVAEQMSQGETTRIILWGMQFDVRVIGNHDFAWSENEVLEESRDGWAEVLASSLKYTGNDPNGFGGKDFVKLQIGCVKVGFFGLTTWSYDDRDQARMNEDFYPDMPTNLDFTAVAQAQIDAHRDEVDLMIPVTHIGVTADGALALSVQGMDAILGGHSHTLLQSINPEMTGGIPIIQAGSEATDVSRLDLTYDLKQKKVIETSYTVTPIEPNTTGLTPDFLTEEMVEHVMAGYAKDSQKPVAQVKAAQGDNAAVAAVAARAALAQLHADAVVMDIATVWNTLPAGAVSPQHLFDCFKVEREPPGTPGFSSLYTTTIDGASLRTLASSSRDGWIVLAPETIDDSRMYVLAGQKRTLNHPAIYLPSGVHIGMPVAAVEVWDALNSYAKDRQKHCQYLDVDETIPECVAP